MQRLGKPVAKALKFCLTVLCTFYVVTLGVLYANQDWMIFPAPRWQANPPPVAGFESVSIETPDGEKLFGLFSAGQPGQPVIMVLHGNADAAYRQGAKGQALKKAGFGVLLLEYRGYPGSTGSPSQSGLITDAVAGYDWINAQQASPVGVYAHSLGTGVALQLATQRDLFAIVLESPYDSVEAVARGRMPWVPVSLLLRHPFRSDDIVHSIKAPLMMLHGTADRTIPIGHGRALATRAGSDAVFIEITGAGHNLFRFGAIEKAISHFQSHHRIGNQ